MRIALTALAYLASLAVVVVASFFAVLFLAGPHGGVLPNWTQPAVLVTGWSTVAIVPVLLARAVWRRLGRRQSPPGVSA